MALDLCPRWFIASRSGIPELSLRNLGPGSDRSWQITSAELPICRIEKRAVDIYSKQTDRFHFLKAFYGNDGKRSSNNPLLSKKR